MDVLCASTFQICQRPLSLTHSLSPHHLFVQPAFLHIDFHSNLSCFVGQLISLCLACVASVSVKQRAKRGFRRFAREKIGARAKNRKEGVGEESEGNACGQTPWFWKPPFASERSWWLAGLVKYYWHVPSAGKNVWSLFTKSVNFSHGTSILIVVSFDSTVEIL